MSAADEACRLLVEQFAGAAGCALVDLANGDVVGRYAERGFDRPLADLAQLATSELFRGANLARIEQAARAQFGLPEAAAGGAREVYLASGGVANFARSICGGAAALLLVTAWAENIGMGWAQVRNAVPAFEALFP